MCNGLDVVEVEVLVVHLYILAQLLEVNIVNGYRPQVVASHTSDERESAGQSESLVECADKVVDVESDSARLSDRATGIAGNSAESELTVGVGTQEVESLAHNSVLALHLTMRCSSGLLVHVSDLTGESLVLALECGEGLLLLLVEFAGLCNLVEISKLVEDLAVVCKSLLNGLEFLVHSRKF